MVGRREGSIISHRPVTSSDLKGFLSDCLNIFATGVDYQQNVGRLLYPAIRGYIFAV